MTVDVSRIEKAEKRLNQLKLDLATLEGQEKQILEGLKNGFDITSLDQAERKLKEMTTENGEHEEKIQSLLTKAESIIQGS